MPAKVASVRWKCPQCGKSKWVKPHEARSRKYCSRECLHASLRVENPVRPIQSRQLARYGTRACPHCGSEFEAKSKIQKYCCQKCTALATIARRHRIDIVELPCETCGKMFRPRPGGAGRFCSRTCMYAGSRGEKASQWNGGRSIDSTGYVRVYAPDHPSAFGHGGYVKEHRLVMEQHLGRRLTRNESVHHINGDKADNRIENLQLRSGRHGQGVIHVCADCGSHNIVTHPIAGG